MIGGQDADQLGAGHQLRPHACPVDRGRAPLEDRQVGCQVGLTPSPEGE
jgi:hypothetical protein